MDIWAMESLILMFNQGRDSLSEATAVTLLRKGRGGHRSGGERSGCGCAVIMILIIFAIVIYFFVKNS